MNVLIVRLGFDVGTRRTGMAKSVGSIITQTAVIESQNSQELAIKIAELISREKPAEVVIGLPLDADYSHNAQTDRVQAVIAKLKGQVKVPLLTVNEFLSTIAVGDSNSPADDDNERAAQAILEQYLNEGGQPA